MTKNIKRMFFVLTLITLLVTVGSVCAVDDANSTGVTDNSVSDVASVSDSTNDTIAAEPVTTNSNDNKVDTKTIEKENKEIKKDNKTDKNKKSDSITIDGVEYSNIIENQIFTEYTEMPSNMNTYINNSTFNVEGDDGLDVYSISFINNSVLNAVLYCAGDKVTIFNSYLNSGLASWSSDIIIDDSNVIGDNFYISEAYNPFNENAGKVYSNNTVLIQKLQEKGIEVYDMSEYHEEPPKETVTIDGVTYDVVKNQEIAASQSIFNNTYFDNCTFPKSINLSIYSIVYINNSYMENYNIYSINPLTIESTVINSSTVYVEGDKLIIKDGVEVYGDTQLIYDELVCDIDFIINYIPTLDGEYVFDNVTVSNDKVNNGNLTIINHSILNASITNNGKLVIGDDTIFGDNFRLTNNGEIVINDTDRLTPYLPQPKETITIDDVTFDVVRNTEIINGYSANDTYFDNCTFKERASLYSGSIWINNSRVENTSVIGVGNAFTIQNTILNSSTISVDRGTLIIKENVTVIGSVKLSYTYGVLVCDDLNFIVSAVSNLNDTYIFDNVTVSQDKVNYGNLTVTNHSILNSSITNNGKLVISDDTLFGDKFTISNNGELIINDTNRLIPYLKVYEGDIVLNNVEISTDRTNNGNLTITNSNISAKIINEGNLTFINCSFSNNEMSTLLDYWNPESKGFLLQNDANASLINCRMENNTFNNTAPQSGNLAIYDCYGAIFNTGNMNITNSIFTNNKLGYAEVLYDLNQGVSTGIGTVIVNKNYLTIDNSTFTNNYAGRSGGSIANYGEMLIKDSVFNNNTATSSGGAIDIENGTTTIINTNFTENKVSDILNDFKTIGGAIAAWYGNLAISECIFDSNSALVYTEPLLAVYGRGGAIGIGVTNATIDDCEFTNNRANKGSAISLGDSITNVQSIALTNVTNSKFNDNIGITEYNYETSIIYDNGHANIVNNSFVNNNASYTIDNHIGIEEDYTATGRYFNETITNNIFENNNNNINTIRINETEKDNITINKNTFTNTTIDDTITLNIPNKIHTGEPITITGTYKINTPDNYDSDILNQNKFNIYINGSLDQTVDTLDFTVTPTAGTMMVTVQPTISQTRKTQAIRATTLTDITITPENYNEYIYEGVLVGVSKDTRVKFSGEFTDKGDIVFETNDLIIDGTNATFTNTTFTLDNENITLQNMNINNNEVQYTITNTFNNNIIANNTITVTNTQTTGAAIYNTASNTLIENNTITQTAPAYDIDFSTGQGVASTQAILLLGGDKNTVQNNNINIEASSSSTYGTLEAITNNNEASNTLITQNTINISGANFNYAIDSLNNVENITITENTITVTGERYCDGIQAGNSANNILIDNNNITCICINTTELTTEGAITYGVIATSMGSYESENITITNNNIDITGTANYGIELYKVNKTEIHNNTITVNGPFSMGIGYAYSPNGNATQNTIITNGDSTTPINQITEEFQPENVGIRIQNGTTNVSITENTITTSDVGGHDSTIHTEPDNVTITNNQLTSSQGYGDETIIAPETATIENNIVETTTTLAVPETIIINTPVELTATVTTADGTPINGGTVTFTIGNEAIAQETVTDGIATATHTFTQEEDDVTIVASYTPESTGLSTSSDEETTTIEIPLTQLNIEEIDLTAGETVTLTATVTDQNGNNINGGKVTFKVNGKTIKDASGKVIYAKVVDGVATAQYTVPENLGGQDITVTAVYSGTSKYNKETTTITTTVTAPEAKLTITPITSDVQTGSTITLKAKVAAGDKAITTGKILFKINGKTVKDTNGKVIYAKVDANGEASVNYTLPESFKAGTYNIEAVFTAPGYEKLTDNTTMTVVKS